MDLSIKNLTKHDPIVIIDPKIPSIPFNMLIIGKSSSGKTNVLLNLMQFYKKHFKAKTIVFTATRNGSLYSLKETHKAKIYNELGDIIQNLMKFQRKIKEKGGKPEYCIIIFDDFINDSSFDKKRSIYTKLFSEARHFNISIIITSQQYTLIPSTVRRLSWYDILFKISNKKEKQIVCYEECEALDIDEKAMESLLNEATEEPFSFLYIDKRKGTFSIKFD